MGGAVRLTRIFVERLWRSVKHEDVYLNGYATMGELLIGLTKYFAFYNGERPHQALGHSTPDADVTQKRQCMLVGVVRGTVYAQRKPKSPAEGDEVL